MAPSSSVPPLGLTLFGGPSLQLHSSHLPLSPFQGAVLGILATHGQRGIRRGELFSLLWSDGNDEVLRRRLNQLIYSLHRRLGESRMIRLVGDAYMFEEGRIASDLESYLAALRDGRLREAIGILSRGFLSGLESTPCAEFERWVEVRELRFRSDLRTLAMNRWREGEQSADWKMTEEAAEILLRLGPHDEDALRKLIESRALRGRVREAESTYTEFLEQARIEDPEFEPGEETVRLLARLGELGRTEMSTRPLRSAVSSYDSLPFVGRGEELQCLKSAIRTIPENGVSLLSVTGDGGIGKTRLVREALTRAPFDGVRVLAGRCFEFERGIPLSPLLGSLASDWVSKGIRRIQDPWRSVLLDLLPEHRSPEDSESTSRQTPVEDVPRVTCEAFLRLFQRLAESEPLVLFIDDFQWIDSTSLAVMSYVRERWDTGGLCILITVREADIEPDSRLRKWINDGAGGASASILSLGPLENPHLTRLLESSISEFHEGEAISMAEHSDTIASIVAYSDGHPLLGLECLQSLLSAGSGVPAPKAAHTVPESLREMVSQRVARLSDPGRDLVRLLSASESPLSASVLRDASKLDREEFARVIDELAARHFILVLPSGIAFQHELLRSGVNQEMTPGSRIDAHTRIADALVSEGNARSAQEIALHLLNAGDPRRAMPFVLDAARTATESGGWAESRHLLTMALESQPTTGECAEIVSLLGRVHFLLGELDEAEARWAEAREAFQALGDEESQLRAELNVFEVQRLRPGSDLAVLLNQVRALRSEADDRGLRRLVAECLGVEVRLLDGLRRYDEVRSLTSGALELVHPVDIDAHVRLLLVAAVEAVYGNPEGAANCADQAADIARENNRPDLLLKALNWKIIALGHSGHLAAPTGREVIEDALNLARLSRDSEQLYLLHSNLGVWHIDAGEPSSAARALSRAEACLKAIAAPNLRRNLLINRGLLALEIGEPREATDLFGLSLEVRGAQDYPPARFTSLAGMGLAHLLKGEITEARRIQDQLPPRPKQWSFDPFAWISFETRLSSIVDRSDALILSVEAEEQKLQYSVAMAWVRLRILRFEILLKRQRTPRSEDVRTLFLFLSGANLSAREEEVHKLFARHRFSP